MPSYPIDLTPEERLLLSLCRMRFTDGQKDAVKDYMHQVTDWDLFVGMANQHAITALAWNNISTTGNSVFIPEEPLQKLYTGYLKTLASLTFMRRQLEEVLSLPGVEDIRIVIIKGFALEEQVYENKGLRQMIDIDILVKQEDAIRLRKILLKNGYESAPFISPVFERKILQHGKHLPEMFKNGMAVEIHFKLFSEAGNTFTEEMIEKAFRVPGGKNIYYPEHQLFFLYLVKHLDRHEREGISQLKLYTDLYLLMYNFADEILNERLFLIAGKVNLRDALCEKLYILEIFWGISFPVWIKSIIEKTDHEKSIEKFIWFIRHHVDAEPKAEQGSLSKTLKDIQGKRNKIMFVVGYIFPSLTYLEYKYETRSKMGAVLYYPVWWLRAVGLVTRRKG